MKKKPSSFCDKKAYSNSNRVYYAHCVYQQTTMRISLSIFSCRLWSTMKLLLIIFFFI